jgi:hypothetical protein
MPCVYISGAAETEFSVIRFKGDKDKAANVYKGFAAMNASDVADQVVFAITRPTHVQVGINMPPPIQLYEPHWQRLDKASVEEKLTQVVSTQINDIVVTSVHQSGARTIARPLGTST